MSDKLPEQGQSDDVSDEALPFLGVGAVKENVRDGESRVSERDENMFIESNEDDNILPEQGLSDDVSGGELPDMGANAMEEDTETGSLPAWDEDIEIAYNEDYNKLLEPILYDDASDTALPLQSTDAVAGYAGREERTSKQDLSRDELPGKAVLGFDTGTLDLPSMDCKPDSHFEGDMGFNSDGIAAEGVLSYPDDHLSSGDDSLLNVIRAEDKGSSSGSSKSGPVGQMQRGYAKRGVDIEDEDEEYEEWKEGGTDIDFVDDMLMGLEDVNSSDFDYKDPFGQPPTGPKMLSYALHDINLQHGVPREAASSIRDLFCSILPADKILDYRTARRHIEKKTGIKEIQYDCCPYSHMLYAMHPDLEERLHCQHPRWKKQNLRAKDPSKKVPYATHSYIPITHPIRLWSSSAKQAALMTSYRFESERVREKACAQTSGPVISFRT